MLIHSPEKVIKKIKNQDHTQRFLFSWTGMGLRGQYILRSFYLGLGATDLAKLGFSFFEYASKFPHFFMLVLVSCSFC